MTVHFWLPHELPRGLEHWNPDEHPREYPTGLGHAMFELWARLRLDGRDVSIGRRIPRHATKVVVFAKSVAGVRSLRLLATSAPIVMIVGDDDHARRYPVRPTVRVVASPAACMRDHDEWIPLLPQRGMRKRKAHDGGLRTIGFFGRRENSPEYLLDGKLAELLGEIGLQLQLALLDDGDDASAPAWEDFSAIDAMLCVRKPSQKFSVAWKPPTKVVNAWVAGCIPVAASEPSYRALARGDIVFINVQTAESIRDALVPLLDRGVFDSMLRNVHERGREYERENVLGAWIEMLSRDPGVRRRLSDRVDLRGSLNTLLWDLRRLARRVGREFRGVRSR